MEINLDMNISSPEWTSYCLSLFQPHEMLDESPRVDGLRRIGQMLLGPILKLSTQVIVATTNEQSPNSTVICELSVLWNREDILKGKVVRCCGAAESHAGNTKELYYRNSVATSESKAESRAWRKILRLWN